jgi:hypothetical protein
MTRQWKPTVFEGARPAPLWRHRHPWPAGWEPYRLRRRSRIVRFTYRQLGLAVAGGTLLAFAIFFGLPAGARGVGQVPLLAPWSLNVIDGDTFDYAGERIRIVGIDAPETHPSRCAYEAELGARATRRLGELLRAGQFELRAAGRDEDAYGRKLRRVYRDGESIGAVLISEGLARPYANGRRPWCR